MKLLIKIGVQISCTPISLFVPPTLPVKGYKKPPVKNFSGHTGYNTFSTRTRNRSILEVTINPFPNKL